MVRASPIDALRAIASQAIALSPEEAEQQTREHLVRIWKEREQREAAKEPSLTQIPRFYVPRSKTPGSATAPAAAASTQQLLQAKLSQLARERLRKHLSSLILEQHELEGLWQLLKQFASPPSNPADERINYDDFCQVAEAMPPRCRKALFAPSHFLKFRPDAHGRISLLHFFQWTRAHLSRLPTPRPLRPCPLLSFDRHEESTAAHVKRTVRVSLNSPRRPEELADADARGALDV
jgi:hypothetical protein